MAKNDTHLEANVWWQQDHLERAELCRAFLLEYGFTVPSEDREINRRIDAARDLRSENDARIQEPEND